MAFKEVGLRSWEANEVFARWIWIIYSQHKVCNKVSGLKCYCAYQFVLFEYCHGVKIQRAAKGLCIYELGYFSPKIQVQIKEGLTSSSSVGIVVARYPLVSEWNQNDIQCMVCAEYRPCGFWVGKIYGGAIKKFSDVNKYVQNMFYQRYLIQGSTSSWSDMIAC